jgi:hypothetical protein
MLQNISQNLGLGMILWYKTSGGKWTWHLALGM